jgi:hypothetical protein
MPILGLPDLPAAPIPVPSSAKIWVPGHTMTAKIGGQIVTITVPGYVITVAIS